MLLRLNQRFFRKLSLFDRIFTAPPGCLQRLKHVLDVVELVRSQLWSTSNQYQSQDCPSAIAKTESGSYTQDGHCYQTKVPVSLAAQGHHPEYGDPEHEKLVVANS